ncbi:hypothetical protein BX661DRAFT_139245 [Kickxella alabastrina]|uniref:uncharacterized protein n=1 Tax=Kickxella alabastrina TaxID=61397 RepID=UPI00222115C0|nr:uncharacterized protein BX661DRAFT_139245 [Kickxella alabastrina]KAI7834432.1 hypothetical protein BX661DRAFT_139245 [Kickxella alabastrina]
MLSSVQPCLALSGSKFRFKLNQLYEVGIGLDGLRGTPAAFGDFNSNQHSDLFVISPDQTTIQLWVWESDLKQFAHLDSADITVPGVILSNVIVGDFNMDGKLDVIVQGQSKGSNEVVMRCYLGDGVNGFSDSGQLPSANGALPFAFDWSGSGRVDLLGAAWDHKDDSDSGVRVWLHLFELRNFGVGNLTVAMCSPASPHSSAFVDLNGDCLPDLFLVCHGNEEYQIWTNSKTGFEYSQTGKLPSNAGPVSFADMNSDGSMDMVIPIVGKSQIYIVYNEQRPLCVGSRKQEGCRKFSRICEADDAFSFSLKDAQVVDIEKMWPGETLSDSLADFQTSVTVPPAVRLTDVDLDGYPDMAFVTHKGKDESHVRMLRSELCPDCKISGGAQLDYRSFVAIKEGVSVLETLGRPQDVAFFDIDGSGTADLLVHYLDSAGSRRVSAIYNNFFTDAFFIKALACPTNEKHVRSYSGFLPGATFKYLVVSDSGEKHVAQSVQAPQSAYRALFTPYTIIGIGRTNNYIEDFSVGSSSQLGVHERSFEGLIPNSQVIVFPVNTTSEWRLELYMNRSESTPYILATLLSSMGLLAITVFALGAMERKADQREKQRALHSINFDAL